MSQHNHRDHAGSCERFPQQTGRGCKVAGKLKMTWNPEMNEHYIRDENLNLIGRCSNAGEAETIVDRWNAHEELVQALRTIVNEGERASILSKKTFNAICEGRAILAKIDGDAA